MSPPFMPLERGLASSGVRISDGAAKRLKVQVRSTKVLAEFPALTPTVRGLRVQTKKQLVSLDPDPNTEKPVASARS